MSDREIPLAGGRTTAGVVKVGDTVRRPRGTHAEFVRLVLRHLEAVGFDGSPRYVGSDEQGREILSYLPGHVPHELGDHDDATLGDAARLIRRYHDATASLFSVVPSADPDSQVACHNDLSPCNTVFTTGHPVALIDFDAAAPGRRSQDLGYAAWLWLDIGNIDRTAPLGTLQPSQVNERVPARRRHSP